MPTRTDDCEQEWARQWENAGREMAELRRQELARMSDGEALAVTENLLSLVGTTYRNPARWSHTGLVEQQALLHRRHDD